MGIKLLQEFIEQNCKSACVPVDLLKISRSYKGVRRGVYDGHFCLVVDAESCLHRLYGGYYSDWVCGGEWIRMITFLTNLVQACANSNMEIVVFFNNALELLKLPEWFIHHSEQRRKTQSVFRHLRNKGTPPPKVWWVPPAFLRGALIMALRHLGVTIRCGKDDFIKEMMSFCNEYKLQGVLGHDSLLTFSQSRYFLSENMKLTYRNSLETTEILAEEVTKGLNLNRTSFPTFAALLGNHILSIDDLREFHKSLLMNNNQSSSSAPNGSQNSLIQVVLDYVRTLPTEVGVDELAEIIFGSSRRKNILVPKFKECVLYYSSFVNCNKKGEIRENTTPLTSNTMQTASDVGLIPTRSEITNTQQAGGDMSGYGDAPHLADSVDGLAMGLQNVTLDESSGDTAQSGPVTGSSQISTSDSKFKNTKGSQTPTQTSMPPVSTDVMKIATERHQKGLMSPVIYQILSQGEAKFDVSLEDELSREFPSVIDLYRPIRQTLYSVLLNLNKLKIIHELQNKDKSDAVAKSFEVVIKEWVVRKGSIKPAYETVIVQPLDWKVPSIERLWLGQQPDDTNRRMRAFLTIMKSDTPLMLNTKIIPQHLLVLCCVLRYLLQIGRILQRHELDAFLATSVSNQLTDAESLQEIKLPYLNVRGVHLGVIFMSGVETAVLANDVCGAPIPWTMCCPWLFFDGKLFQSKLHRSLNNTPLIEICDGQVEQTFTVENMRHAIMEDIKIEFAKPMLFGGYDPHPFTHPWYQRPPTEFVPPQMYPYPTVSNPRLAAGRSSILGGRSMDARGGQLEVAGIVVGSWGPNLGGRGSQPTDAGRRGIPLIQRGLLSRRPIRGRPGAMYNFGRGFRMDKPLFLRTGAPLMRNKKRRGGVVNRSKARGTTVLSQTDGAAVVSVKQLLSTTQKNDQETNDLFADAEEIVEEPEAPMDLNGETESDELEDSDVIQVNGDLDLTAE